MSDIEYYIVENGLGKFQVRDSRGDVLCPSKPAALQWFGPHQQDHDFMWVDSKAEAERILKQATKKHTIVKQWGVELN